MKKLTASDLLAGAKTRIKTGGTPSWITTHPHRVAIIAALKQGASPAGVARMLTENGPVPVSHAKIKRLSQAIREGKY